jgi:putative addiction module antidote
MHAEVKIRRIGNSTGATIPKKMLERQNLAEGDSVIIVETEMGLLITPFDQDFSKAMEIYQMGDRTYRNAMRELAK